MLQVSVERPYLDLVPAPSPQTLHFQTRENQFVVHTSSSQGTLWATGENCVSGEEGLQNRSDTSQGETEAPSPQLSHHIYG